MEMSLRQSCQRDNDFFKGVINLIPPMFYFDSDSKHKLKEITQDSLVSEGSSHKNEWKLSKFDPTCVKTVTEMQKELISRENNTSDKSLPIAIKRKTAYDDCSMKSATDSLEELREKLHHKLQLLKEKRKCMKKADWLEKRRLKRKASKVKSRLKRSVDVRDEMPRQPERKPPVSKPAKPIYNSQGNVVFSKFDFSDTNQDDKPDRDILTGKNYKQLLEKVQRQKQQAQQLQQVDPNKAQQLQGKNTWNSVMQKAKGIKVKNNEDLLKKALKRKDKLKQKSKKNWESRQEKVDEKIKDSQDKRKRNIKKKKQAKVDRKLKKAKKKGRAVPGF